VKSEEETLVKKNDGLFNRAFQDLDIEIKESKKASKITKTESGTTDGEGQGDGNLFLEAMSGVTPLPGTRRKITRSSGDHIRPPYPAPDDKREGMARLHDLIKGATELDITLTDEYIEGSVKGISRKLMKTLKKGQFPVQDHIDLHGLTKKEAEIRVRDFLLQSSRRGFRCVLIVHGRGLNSQDSLAVLKANLPIWLTRGPVRKIVLAFATARPYDGGAGAVYVLLRRGCSPKTISQKKIPLNPAVI
jgi:DNA-nicking Smr family endonuclease